MYDTFELYEGLRRGSFMLCPIPWKPELMCNSHTSSKPYEPWKMIQAVVVPDGSPESPAKENQCSYQLKLCQISPWTVLNLKKRISHCVDRQMICSCSNKMITQNEFSVSPWLNIQVFFDTIKLKNTLTLVSLLNNQNSTLPFYTSRWQELPFIMRSDTHKARLRKKYWIFLVLPFIDKIAHINLRILNYL